MTVTQRGADDDRKQMLRGLNVVEVSDDLAVSVCGRLFADLGAEVHHQPVRSNDANRHALAIGKHAIDAGAMDAGGREHRVREARVLLACGAPGAARAAGVHPEQLRALNPEAIIVHLSPRGLTGPEADRPATDLTLFAESGIAHLLTGQVELPAEEPPQRAVGEQSAFVAGAAAACAAMNAVRKSGPALLDVARFEALATLAVTELTRAASGLGSRPRLREGDGNGATVCILPCADGYVAISPREAHQWRAWVGVMGDPKWADEQRFSSMTARVRNFDALHQLMSAWSREQPRDVLARAAQDARVPCFALRRPAEQLDSEQLAARGFFQTITHDGDELRVPASPFRVRCNTEVSVDTAPELRPPPHAPPRLPLEGVRVLDFSWVIAGPTSTRYLAALGAEVIKVEAPGRGDPGRASELHAVLGRAKRAITLDLKHADGVRVAKQLASECDLLIENFATGVMQRFGLDAATLTAENPRLSYISASGLGREGPEARAAAYGTLLQCYSGFAGLNGVPGRAPRVGMAWLDPLCGLLLSFAAGAALYAREQTGRGVRIDFSMVEAMLWTMLEPLVACQQGEDVAPRGNRSAEHVIHDIFATRGDDRWIAIATPTDVQWRALAALVPGLAPHTEADLASRRSLENELNALVGAWCGAHTGDELAALLAAAQVPYGVVADSQAVAGSAQLRARDFWQQQDGLVMPRLPWLADFPECGGTAPGLGEHTREVLTRVLGASPEALRDLEANGAFGPP